jgi:SAM-dependent methyltransferase
VRRILRALAALDIFSIDGDTVRNTPKSELLRAEAPGSVAWIAQSFANEHYLVWEKAEHAFRTGTAATPDVLGSGYFDWLADHPAEASIFNRAMAAGSALKLASLDQLDWSDQLVVDVGGGTGGLLSGLLARHPALRGIVVDLPHSEAAALETFAAAGVADRATFLSGDFFEAVPAGGDAYVLSHILHDWDDEPAHRILRAIRDAAGDGARLAILDNVLGDGPGELVPKLIDLHMLVLVGGRERTRDEWERLLAAAGFSLERVYTDGPLAAIEAATIAL